MNVNHWKNKRVLLTGHTGFKGSWMSLWLSQLGAEVHGVSLPPATQPNLYSIAKIHTLLASDTTLDICNLAELKKIVAKMQPDIVFHLAAQSLVHYSYDFPIETYAVNVMGTANILEAVRFCDSVRAAVIVTTDKCYENREWIYPYREPDRLGGRDPYSNSKACAELVSNAYRASFFSADRNMHLATARAGNVIGGGDWASDRLIPDCIRALSSGDAVSLRKPQAVRPWQHVLESISGYLLLGEHLLGKNGSQFAEAWNFGPNIEDMKSVGDVAVAVCQLLNIPINVGTEVHPKHEASLLLLDSTKAKEYLKWTPRWQLQKAVTETVAWYRHWLDGDDMLSYSQAQIKRYQTLATPVQTENNKEAVNG